MSDDQKKESEFDYNEWFYKSPVAGDSCDASIQFAWPSAGMIETDEPNIVGEIMPKSALETFLSDGFPDCKLEFRHMDCRLKFDFELYEDTGIPKTIYIPPLPEGFKPDNFVELALEVISRVFLDTAKSKGEGLSMEDDK